MVKRIDPRDLKWINKPKLSLVFEDSVVFETEPFTDFNPKGISSDVAEMAIEPVGSFCFTLKVDYRFQNNLDQCGMILYQNDVRKAIICTQSFDLESTKLATTVNHGDIGDRAYRDISAGISTMYFRIWCRGGIVRIQYSFTNGRYSDLRIFKLDDVNANIKLSIYACSPVNSYFDCTFSNMILEDEE